LIGLRRQVPVWRWSFADLAGCLRAALVVYRKLLPDYAIAADPEDHRWYVRERGRTRRLS
jgi:hypothetical protein